MGHTMEHYGFQNRMFFKGQVVVVHAFNLALGRQGQVNF